MTLSMAIIRNTHQKTLVALICYVQGFLLNRLFSKFERRERMKQLINAELVRKQMEVTDRIWRIGEALVKQSRTTAAAPSPEIMDIDSVELAQVAEEISELSPSAPLIGDHESLTAFYPILI